MTLGASCRSVWAACAAACLGLSTNAWATGDVVISQVWGSAGLAGAPNADYVELFNRTANPVNMTGWSVQVASGTGSTWAKLDLAATIQPYSYYLIRVQSTTAGVAYPADAVFAPTSTSLSTSGKVGLRSTTTLFTGSCPVTDGTQNGTIIDFVGYGTATGANCREGTTNAPVGTSAAPGGALHRVASGCVDTDESSADWFVAAPQPRDSSFSTGGCVTGACCNTTTGGCMLALGAGCTGSYQGDGTSCSPSPCPASGACCSGATGTTCTVLTTSGCAGIGGFYQGDASSCTPNPCVSRACCFADGTCCLRFAELCTSQGGTPAATSVTCVQADNCILPPANDACSNPIVLTSAVPAVGNNFSALSNDGQTVACMTGSPPRTSRGVWFTFTPPISSTFTVTTCGTLFDNGLEIFLVGDCADFGTFTPIACDDNLCPTGTASFCGLNGNANAALIQGVQLNAGVTYHLRLSTKAPAGTGNSDNYTIQVNDTGVQMTGACCFPLSGVCNVLTQAGCTGSVPPGTYQGDGTACTTPCAGGPFGACCFSSSACLTRAQSACTTTGGTYQGDGTACFATGPDICIREACCNNTTGACTVRGFTRCQGFETGQGADTTCTPVNPCPAQGACCDPCTFACTGTIQAACTEGTWHAATSCSPNLCNTFAPVPGNDAPCNAVTLTAGTSTTGSIGAATANDDGPAASCAATPGPAVWYQFMPGATSYYSVSTCGATFDTVLTVLTGDCNTPASMTIVACEDVGCSANDPVVCGEDFSSPGAASIPFVLMDAGTTYFIRVSPKASTTARGSFPVLVTAFSAGACCNPSGTCAIDEADHCLGANEFYVGNNTSCSPHPCPATGACCNNCTFTCTLTFQTACSTGSTFLSSVTSCSPNPCGLIAPAPTNDLPCDAIALTLNTPVVGAVPTATSTDDGPEATCRTADSRNGVWYSFSPTASGNFTISTCGATFNSVLTVFTGDCSLPAFFTEVACDEDLCPGGEPVVCGTGSSSLAAAIIPVVAMSEGTTYYIRVQRSGFSDTAIGGTFPLIIQPAPGPAGACCASCGTCLVNFASACPSGYQGDGTICSPNPCLALVIPNDDCANAIVIGPTFPFNDSRCNRLATTDGPGASCDNPVPFQMLHSLWYVFTPAVDGALNVTMNPDSSSKIFTIHATTGQCPADQSTEVGCDDGNPAIILTSAVAGTTYYIMVGDQGTANDGSLYSITVNFTPVTGACCRGSTCSITTAAACTGGNAAFAGPSTACNAPGNDVTPCCKADFNRSGAVTVQDIFAFLTAWFAQDSTADINATGGITVADIFAFLTAWFAGCS